MLLVETEWGSDVFRRRDTLVCGRRSLCGDTDPQLNPWTLHHSYHQLPLRVGHRHTELTRLQHALP